MKFLLTALGSYGDVHPMVGLAEGLLARGHQPIVITNPHFQSIVESTGAGFHPLGIAEDYDRLARHPDLWHPLRGPVLIVKEAMAACTRPLYAAIDSLVTPGKTVLVAHCLDLASRVHQEVHGTPLASVHFAPVTFRSATAPPRMFGMLQGSWVPDWLSRMQFWLADQFADRVIGAELTPFRRELGLPAVKRVMHEWYFSPQLVLGLFPEWFAPPQADWLPQIRLAGFPLWDQSSISPLEPQLEEFLQAGAPPIVFAPGSAMTEGAWFFRSAVEACIKLRRRGILLTKYPEQLPAQLPAEVKHFPFVPFSQLLPRAAAIVHHGGIGTSAQSLAAGIAEVVMPMAYDQLDNATRLVRLGVAEILPRKKFTAERLAEALEKQLSSPTVTEKAHHWAQQIDPQRSLNDACESLERLAK